MLAFRPRQHRLVLSFFSPFLTRSTSTSTSVTSSSGSVASQLADELQDSIFTATESPWDHVFSDIEPEPPLLPATQRIRSRVKDGNSFSIGMADNRTKNKGNHSPGLVQRASKVRGQRASMTAREMSVFDEMFDLIFNAVSARDGKTTGPGSLSAPVPATSPPSLSFSGQTPSIGRAGAPLNDLFRTLRRHTSRVRWTTAIDEELDRKKETMELFNTDHELLQWVMQEVFGESQRWDEEAKRANAASKTKEQKKGSESVNVSTAATSTSSPTPVSSSSHQEHPINHSIYPHLIAHAMRIFRTTYSNPSLSLAVFNHAARVSIPSYVFGCTAPAYNELIEARWEGWGNLEGVCSALEEMRANGVKVDGRTRIVVEKIRREVGEARPGETRTTEGEEGIANRDGEEDVNPLARRVWGELGDAEAMRLLHRIERLALRDRSRNVISTPQEEAWKNAVLQPSEGDEWSFDRWDKESKMTRRRGAKPTPSAREIDSRTFDRWAVSEGEVPETAIR